MKRFLAMLLALSMLLVFTGCDLFSIEKAEEEFDLDECLEEVEELVEDGELEKAEKLLKKALKKTDDEDEIEILEEYLELVQALMEGESDPQKEAAHASTAPMDATEPTQRPATTDRPLGDDKINLADTLDRKYLYKINVFLSNFAEQGFSAYPCSDYDLLMFGYMFAKINNRQVLGSTNTHYYVNKADMDSILNRFFGCTVNLMEGTVLDERNYPVTYQEGAYFYPGADGASVSYCAVVTSMTENSDGTYDVAFDVYEHVEPHASMSSYYELNAGEARNCADLKFRYSGNAVVRDYVRSGNIETYQLISYSHS